MPTYVYHCNDCGAEHVQLRPVGDRDAPRLCERCQAGVLLREIAAPMVNLAGQEAAGRERKGTSK